jgi:hypothetical protein
MNRRHFEFLPADAKMKFLENSCVRVAKRVTKNFQYTLYQSDTFYIELQVYTRYRISNRLFCFVDPIYLEPYLAKIDIYNHRWN